MYGTSYATTRSCCITLHVVEWFILWSNQILFEIFFLSAVNIILPQSNVNCIEMKRLSVVALICWKMSFCLYSMESQYRTIYKLQRINNKRESFVFNLNLFQFTIVFTIPFWPSVLLLNYMKYIQIETSSLGIYSVKIESMNRKWESWRWLSYRIVMLKCFYFIQLSGTVHLNFKWLFRVN